MKKNRILLRRVIAALLTLMLVFSSSYNMFSTIPSAAAESNAAAEKPDDGENGGTGEGEEDPGADKEVSVTEGEANQIISPQKEETVYEDGVETPKTGDDKENVNTEPAEPQDSGSGKDSPGIGGNEEPSGTKEKEEASGTPGGEEQTGTEEKEGLSGTPGGEEQTGTEEKEGLSDTPGEGEQSGTDKGEAFSEMPGAGEPSGMDEGEGIATGGEADGWKLYWLGDTPETAKTPEQTLICLRVNEATDEADAFRTSVNMLRNGEEPADMSLYLYRDSKSDRMGIEKYNCMFFDTPEGEESLVKVVTNVLMNRKLEMPKTLRIVLRGFALEGADLPAYAISGHFFAMNDGTDGRVSMFGGVYEATCAGDVFDSPYIRIEGITDGPAVIVIKQGQPIWPEWTGPDTAEDIEGNHYIRMDDKWYWLTEGKDV